MTISKHCAMCMSCFKKEQVGTIWCYNCGTPMTMQERLPISTEHLGVMVQDSSDKLMARLGLRNRTTDSTDARRIRGTKKRVFDGLTCAQRMRSWRKGAYKKKHPVSQECLYRYTDWPITVRWQNDPDFQYSCNQMAQAYFDCDLSYEMVVEADELAQREEKEAQERSQTYGIPSDQRVQRFSERPEIRSTQSGGANTRPRVGTFEERRAPASYPMD